MDSNRSHVLVRRARNVLRTRPLAYWALTLAVAALLGVGVEGTMRQAAATRAQWGTTIDVLVARRDVRPGEALDAFNTELRQFPVAVVADGVLGRLPARAVATAPIAAGEPIHPVRLGRGGASTLAALLPDGTRGVAFPVAEGLHLEPGDRVDIVAALTGTVVAQAATVVRADDRTAVVAVASATLVAVAAAIADGGAVVALGP